MDNKNTMSRFLIALSLLAATSAHAECYVRSETMSQMTSKIERIADVERRVLPVENGATLCRITFRAYIDGKWYDAEGSDTADAGSSLDSSCARAMNTGRISILEVVGGTKITGQQELICTDEPKKQEKAYVNVGDVVWESEVQPHPVQKNQFNYRGSICRWFVESNPKPGFVNMHQGIICRAPNQKVWRVVDKW